MCGVKDETRGADAIQLCGEPSHTRIGQGEAETDSRPHVKKTGRRLRVRMYLYTLWS